MGWRHNKRKRLGNRKRPPAVLGFFSLPLAALVLLISCSSPFETPTPAPIAPGMGRAVINLGGEGPRTLMPETPVFVQYTLVFTAPGKTTVSKDLTETGAIGSLEGSGYGVDLEPGTWDLTVTAYTRLDSASSYLEAAKNTTSVPVSIGLGASVDVSVTIDHLPADGTKKGFLSWNIGLPVLGPGDSAELIYTMQGGPPVTQDLKTAPSGVEELDSGYYLVTILLTKNGKAAGRTEEAHIYPGLTTRAGVNRPDFTVFTDADFVDMKYLAGTAAVVKPGSLTLYPVYVKAYEDLACVIPIVTDPLSVIVSSGDKWSMKIPVTQGDVYLRLETSGGGRSFNAAAAHETGAPDNGRSGIALSMVIYALSQTITGPGSVGIDVAGQGAYAMEGETVALTVSPDPGCGLKPGTLLVKETSSGAPVTLSGSGGSYSFAMPAADITVTAEFVAVGTHTARRGVTLYTSLKDAIDAAPAGSASSPDEITLLKTIELPESGTIGYVIDKHIRLVSSSGTNTIERKNTFTNDSLFTIDSGASLTLDGSPNALVIDGKNVPVTAALITVNGGMLNMNDGITLRNNRNTSATIHGGGVRITGGSFTMNGGTITGNTAGENGGGVCVTSGSFIMNGGTITGNEATTRGGGVYVSGSGSLFEMKSGTIGGSSGANNAANGGGVLVSNGASFIMTAGSITENTATNGGAVYNSNATFTMKAGFITGNKASSGGGVCIIGTNPTRFEMQGGSITGNAADSGSRNGGGVYISGSGSRFEMQGGTLGGIGEENTVGSSGSGGGVYVANPGVFAMSGSASLIGNGVHVFGTITMEGGARVADEWVYLTSGTVITIKDDMTGEVPVAVIYPENSASGTKVLDGTSPLIPNNKAKFNVDIAGSNPPPPYSGSNITIDGRLP